MSGITERITAQIPYRYHNAPIPGGGYVTGFVFHKKVPGILYARTDIGGCTDIYMTRNAGRVLLIM